MIFSKEELLWDLGVKIKIEDKTAVTNTEKGKNNLDNKLFNEITGLSNKLNISQKIIDQESKLISQKIDKKQSLIFDNLEQKERKNSIGSKGANAYQVGRYKDALKYLDKINNSNIAKVEKNKIYYLKANAYFNLGEHEKAEEYLSKLISEKPNNLSDDALLLKGIILKEQGKKKAALSIFTQIITDHPNSEFYESAQIQKRILSNIKK